MNGAALIEKPTESAPDSALPVSSTALHVTHFGFAANNLQSWFTPTALRAASRRQLFSTKKAPKTDCPPSAQHQKADTVSNLVNIEAKEAKTELKKNIKLTYFCQVARNMK